MSDVCEKCKEWRSPRTASCRWHLRTYPEAMPISCAGVRSLTPIFYAAFERHRPGAVIHFAAYVGESMLRPLAYYRINVAGLVSILEAMLRYHTQTIVFSSSCATYGIPDGLPIAENAPQRPINPYGRSKLVGEQFLVDAHTADGLRIAILRYFNAAGADPEGQLVERHNPETLQSRWPPSSYRVVFGRLPAAPS